MQLNPKQTKQRLVVQWVILPFAKYVSILYLICFQNSKHWTCYQFHLIRRLQSMSGTLCRCWKQNILLTNDFIGILMKSKFMLLLFYSTCCCFRYCRCCCYCRSCCCCVVAIVEAVAVVLTVAIAATVVFGIQLFCVIVIPANRATRWQFNIWPFATMKICPIAIFLPK